MPSERQLLNGRRLYRSEKLPCCTDGKNYRNAETVIIWFGSPYRIYGHCIIEPVFQRYLPSIIEDQYRTRLGYSRTHASQELDCDVRQSPGHSIRTGQSIWKRKWFDRVPLPDFLRIPKEEIPGNKRNALKLCTTWRHVSGQRRGGSKRSTLYWLEASQNAKRTPPRGSIFPSRAG